MECQGEMASNIKPLRATWYMFYEREQFNGTCSVDLYQCEDEVPPTRCTPSVRTLGKLSCGLDVEYSDLPDFKSKTGVMMKKLEFELELVPSGASVEFVLYVDGRKQGSERAKIRFA
jgi:hypothetical protein